jgi:hypothetical protein
MNKVTFFVDKLDGLEHAILEHADGSFTSMPKEVYDKHQAEQSTPMIPGDD